MNVSATHPGEYALMVTIPALEQRCRRLERELAEALEINDRMRERIAGLVGDLDASSGGTDW